MAGKQVQVALVQMQCGTDVSINLERSIVRIRQAAERGAQVICL